MPIIELEVLINSPDMVTAETMLRAESLKRLQTVADGQQVMLKPTIRFFSPVRS